MGSLRFLLALCVVGTHAPGGKIAGLTLLSGVTAVQGFYIVSGFLITMVLNTRREYRDLVNFYLSRYLRLWPAYLVVASLSFFVIKKDWLLVTAAKLDLPSLLLVTFANATILLQDFFL